MDTAQPTPNSKEEPTEVKENTTDGKGKNTQSHDTTKQRPKHTREARASASTDAIISHIKRLTPAEQKSYEFHLKMLDEAKARSATKANTSSNASPQNNEVAAVQTLLTQKQNALQRFGARAKKAALADIAKRVAALDVRLTAHREFQRELRVKQTTAKREAALGTATSESDSLASLIEILLEENESTLHALILDLASIAKELDKTSALARQLTVHAQTPYLSDTEALLLQAENVRRASKDDN